MESIEINAQCPFCGRMNELATPTGDATVPHDGAVSLCIKCGEWAVFQGTDTLTLRKPTDDEYTDFAKDKHMIKARAIWVRMNQEREMGEDR